MLQLFIFLTFGCNEVDTVTGEVVDFNWSGKPQTANPLTFEQMLEQAQRLALADNKDAILLEATMQASDHSMDIK